MRNTRETKDTVVLRNTQRIKEKERAVSKTCVKMQTFWSIPKGIAELKRRYAPKASPMHGYDLYPGQQWWKALPMMPWHNLISVEKEKIGSMWKRRVTPKSKKPAAAAPAASVREDSEEEAGSSSQAAARAPKRRCVDAPNSEDDGDEEIPAVESDSGSYKYVSITRDQNFDMGLIERDHWKRVPEEVKWNVHLNGNASRLCGYRPLHASLSQAGSHALCISLSS